MGNETSATPRRGRKPADKCERETTVESLVIALDERNRAVAVRDAALAALNAEFETRRAAVQQQHEPAITELNKQVFALAEPLRADWKDEHQVPADFGGGTLCIVRLSQKGSDDIRFYGRQTMTAAE